MKMAGAKTFKSALVGADHYAFEILCLSVGAVFMIFKVEKIGDGGRISV